jgi:eukaryotic-like serine/threonine-protein kinase
VTGRLVAGAVAVSIGAAATGAAAEAPAGLWPQFRFGPAHTGATAAEHVLTRSNVGRLRLAWSFRTGGPVWSSAAVRDGTVYIGSNDGHVYALRLSDGARLWTAAVSGDPSAPAVVGRAVYVFANDGFAYAFDVATGMRLWRTDVLGFQGGFPAAATVVPGTVFVQDEGVAALDATTGSIRWRRPIECFGCPVAAANGTVYAAGVETGDVGRASLFALDAATGATRWAASLDGGAGVTPSIANGAAYVGVVVAPGARVRPWAIAAIDVAAGRRLWRVLIGRSRYLTFSSLAVAAGRVVFPSPAGRLVALDARTGRSRWSVPLEVTNSAPAVANGVVYVGSTDRRVYAFDLRTGRRLWAFSTGGEITSSPTVAAGTVIVGSDDGVLRAFRLRK